ncbi:type 1 fimbrial protein [Yersinia mollaretii]|uniref:fimbrial protein n=1 Tax=Yersinia mollaretii TaxID=33060 RepID=UPI001427A182|nr:fimbrial protein [Yersinia mollaretii]MDA5533617.1 fimbrial protein [Yersinia mollaretii]NIL01549.1 type 1 fimbrial protein [Yersinia mollaretii]
MPLLQSCRRADTAIALTSLFICVVVLPVQAVEILDFHATIVPGTCAIKLDQEFLNLGSVQTSSLSSGAVTASNTFSLEVQNCSGTAPGSQKPVIQVSGSGDNNDGKWLFRDDDSVAQGVGVLLTQDMNTVSDGDKLQFQGILPPATGASMAFSAGVSCINSGGCNPTTGKLIARVTFNFLYD